MVLCGRFRRCYWKSWLALGLLVAAAGGFVLTTASAGHRTADAFPRFTARHGYDVIVYSGQPLPQLARLSHNFLGQGGAHHHQRHRWLRVLPQADRHQ